MKNEINIAEDVFNKVSMLGAHALMINMQKYQLFLNI